MKSTKQLIRYLNLDVELESENDLTALVEHLGEEIFILCNQELESIFYTSFEPKYFEEEENTPENHPRHILGVLENLPDSLRDMWNQCSSKIFDFGFDSGFGPCPFYAGLSPESLQGISAIGANIRITIYPAEYTPNQEDKPRTKRKRPVRVLKRTANRTIRRRPLKKTRQAG